MRRCATATCLILAIALPACGGDDDDETPKPAPKDTSAQRQEKKAVCKKVKAPPAKADGGQTQPTEKLEAKRSYAVEMRTSCGDFTIQLNVKSAPKAAASFVALARKGFFEDTVFHRVVPGIIVQGGDPTGTGRGGPGYQTVDDPPKKSRYKRGVVAMAKAGPDPRGAAGSQFFVVLAGDLKLAPDFAILGRVTKGREVAEAIGRLGDPSTEKPKRPVVVEKATVKEKKAKDGKKGGGKKKKKAAKPAE